VPSSPEGHNFLVGVDLGGTWVRVGLADLNGEIRRRARARTVALEGPDGVLSQIAELVRQLVELEPEARLERLVLAVGVPGPVDGGAGVVIGAPNLPGWRWVAVKDRLEQALGCTCLVEHDVSLAALAEHRLGAGRGAGDFVYVTVSTGISAGLILGGRLHRGFRGGAGEFGHMVVVPDGPLCNCGNRGCLEALASGTAIAREAGLASASEVTSLAEKGDPNAQAVLATAARYLALALGGLINLLNPEVLALGGGVLASSPSLYSGVLASIPDATFSFLRGSCRVERAQLGEDQGLLGAVGLALDFARARSDLPAEVARP
jgi:glucokinase